MYTASAYRLTLKTGLLLFACMALILLGQSQGAFATARSYAGVEINYGDYDYLSDYGEWAEIPPFGMVWYPYVVEDWGPFYHGHWSWTTDGWAWISYEPFGWLVYHYGYWYHRPHIGWFWVPGRIWSPARVQWYTYGNYFAWAPLPPPHYYWPNPWEHHGAPIWIVVDANHFTDDNIGHHRVTEPFQREVVKRDGWVRRAPTIQHVETATRQQLPAVRISREWVDVRPGTSKGPTRYVRPREYDRKKMVLPEQEMNKVKQHAPQVQREVLTHQKNVPKKQQRPPEGKTGGKTKSKAQETQKKTQDTEKTKVRRR